MSKVKQTVQEHAAGMTLDQIEAYADTIKDADSYRMRLASAIIARLSHTVKLASEVHLGDSTC